MRTFDWKRPLTIAALALYPILFLFSKFPGESSWDLSLLPIALSIAASLLLYALIRIVSKRVQAAFLMTVVLLILFWAFGHVANALGLHVISQGAGNGANIVYVNPVVLLLWSLLAAFSAYGLFRRSSEAFLIGCEKIAMTITATLLTLVLLPMAWSSLVPAQLEEKTAATSSGGPSSLGYDPDIYFIVLDGYGRADYLKKYFDFDNSEFLGALEKRGFQVLSESWADYPKTFLSLASALNMRKLTEILQSQKRKTNLRGPLHKMIRDNEVSRILRARGYRYVHLASTGGETITNPAADVIYSCRQSRFKHELYRVLVESSALRIFYEDVGIDLAACHLDNHKTLGDLPGLEKSPKFVFAHFVSPHHPYLFDRHGNILKRATISNQFKYDKMLWGKRDKYVDQLIFVSNRILESIDKIQQSPQAPIIVLVSDHGPWAVMNGLEESERKRVRLGNLQAVYFPQQKLKMPEDQHLKDLFKGIFSALLPEDPRFKASELAR